MNVAVLPDPTAEPNETVPVALSSPSGGYTLAPGHSTGVLTILNDDVTSGLNVRVGDASVCVSDLITPTVKVLVSLSAPATSTVSVVFTIADGTAGAGRDFKQFKPKTLTFTAGQFQKVVAIQAYPISGDGPDKTATLTLSNPSDGLSLGRATGTLTFISE